MIKKKYAEIAEMLNIDYDKRYADVLVEGVSIDTRSIVKNNLFVPLKGERVDSHDFVSVAIENGASVVLWNRSIKSPPTDYPVLFVEDTRQALSDLAAAYRKQCSYIAIGITGSNGKTSTKDMIAGVLSQKYKVQKTSGNHNNEIGVPLTLLAFDEDCEIGVIEMGMENLHEIEELSNIVKPDMGVITNVGVAHLENLGSMENIAKAKCELIEGIKQGGYLFYNGDDKLIQQAVQTHDCARLHKATFGHDSKNDCHLYEFRQDEKGIHFKTSLSEETFTCHIYGEHQAMNACAAILCAKQLGLTDKEIQQGFLKVENTGMRNELEKVGHCLILNDAYKSNPQSALAALATFEHFESPYKIVVLGDMLELGPTSPQLHEELGEACQDYQMDELYCIGDMAQHIAIGASRTCSCRIHSYLDRNELYEAIKDFTKKDCMMLVKGSRGMKLDEVINQLKEKGECYE